MIMLLLLKLFAKDISVHSPQEIQMKLEIVPLMLVTKETLAKLPKLIPMQSKELQQEAQIGTTSS